MAEQALNLKIKGLYTSSNEFSELPQGALTVANNVDILQDGIAQPRRGFDLVTGSFSDASYRVASMTEYQSKVIAHAGSSIGTGTALYYLSSGSWTVLETVSAPSGTRMRFVGANNNLYYTTSAGVKVLDAYNGTPRIAGAYKGLEVTASVSATSTWLANNYYVAYRALWFYKDTNNNFIYGAPSGREVFRNTAGAAKSVSLAISIPSGITTSWYLQVYRTASSSTVPGEEMFLVYETQPSAGDIAAKSITVSDITPDEMTGASLYTSPSQEGIGFSNEQPPLSQDIEAYADCMFYANTVSKHRFYLNILGTGASTGVQVNDTITIGGITYTGKAAETVASREFKVTSVGVSAAADIEATALSLIRVINQYSSSTVYAYYLSAWDGTPGKILLEERSIGGASFAVTSSRSTCWSPSNIPTSGTTTSSTNDDFGNALYWSKPLQPGAVPLANFMQVGSKSDEILRIKALRDGLYIFKQSGQVWKLTGTYPTFSLEKIEDSVKLLAPESVSVLNGQIYALTDQGVVSLSDSTQVLSRPIEQDLLSLVNQNRTLVSSLAFGYGYETDRKYYLFLPESSSSTYCTFAYVYNTFAQSWTKHIISSTAAQTTSSGDFYLGSAENPNLFSERRNYTFLDYADYGFAGTISTISGTDLTIAAGFDNLSVGDILYQSSSVFAQITALNTTTETITIDADPGLSAGAVTVLYGIPVTIKWAPIAFDNPGIQHQFHTVSLLFKSDFVGSADLTFSSDVSPSDESVTLTGRDLSLWGLFAWGESEWGGAPLKRPTRQWIPKNKQRCGQLNVSFGHSYGYTYWELQGISVFGTSSKEEISRD